MKSYPKPKLSRRERRLSQLLLAAFFSTISFLPQQAIAQIDHGNSNSTIPSARWGQVMAYDPVRDKIILFGGAPTRTEMLDDTWEWDGSKWQKLHVSGPTPRAYAAMAFDSKRGQMFLFGGRIRDGENFIPYGDTWIWDGVKWHETIKDESKIRREENLKVEVLNAITQFSAAFVEADAEKLHLLLAPNYRHTNTDGSVVSRERWLEWVKSRREKIASGELKIEKYDNENVEVVLLSPTIAVATGRNIAIGVDSGKPFRIEIRFTHVWAKQNNQWQRTVFHDSRITERNTQQ